MVIAMARDTEDKFGYLVQEVIRGNIKSQTHFSTKKLSTVSFIGICHRTMKSE